MARLIRGRYEAVHVAGRGGQAEVIRAIDRMHDRSVAIKVRRVRSPDERQAVLAEARQLFALRPHPGISVVREDFFVGDRYHLVMDWVDGRNLEQRLNDDGPLTVAEVIFYLGQVAEALDHLHRSQPPVIHKDVKPANIVVDGGDRAVLVDFGLAQEGHGYGTPGFTAPEIMADGLAAPATDVFGLAATAFALLTGRPPGAGERIDLPEPHGARISAVLRRALSLLPEERPPTATALVAALRPPLAPNNLPASLTSFVGRDRELSLVERRLRAARLVTIVGTGGSGKTRLAVACGRGLLGEYADGVRLAELAAATDRVSVARVVAAACGVSEDRDPEEAVAAKIGRGRMLLVLDNCEHVLGAVASLADAWLRQCPHLSVLATSRQTLGVDGESVVDLAGLEVAPRGATLEVMAATPAIELFVERALVAQPRFRLDPETAGDVAEICHRLEGIPLALELAASQLRRRPWPDLVGMVEQRMSSLATTQRRGPKRHRTLEASIDWSVELLDRRERALFRRLAVFAGGFGVEAVTGVCRDADALAELVNASLVAGGPGPEARYRLLEPVRQYATTKLEEVGEAEAIRDRHAEWFAAWAGSVAADLEGPREQRALARLEDDEDNVRAAFARLVATGHYPQAARLATALVPFSEARGRLAERRSWLDAVVEAPGLNPADRARGLVGITRIAYAQGDFAAAITAGEEAITIFTASGDRLGQGRSQHALGIVVGEAGDLDAALARFDEAQAIGRVEGDDLLLARVLTVTGQLAQRRADYRWARACFEEALAIATTALGPRVVAFLLANVGLIDLLEHDLGPAEDRFRRGLALAQDVGDRRTIGVILRLLGHLAMAKDEPGPARDFYSEAITVWQEEGREHLMGWDLDNLGEAYSLLGDHQRAAVAFGAADAVRDRVGSVVEFIDADGRERRMAATRAALGQEPFDRAWAEGRSLPLDEIASRLLAE